MNMINVLQRLAELDSGNPNVVNPMVKKQASKTAMAEAGFPGAPDVEMPPMKSSGDPKRDSLKKEYMDIHREIKSLVDIPYSDHASSEEKMRARNRIKELNRRADEIKAILEPSTSETYEMKEDISDTVNECGMMGGGSDYHSPASISMTADSGEEIGDMLQAIAQLAGIKKYEPDADSDMDHDKEVVVGHDGDMDQTSVMRKMIDSMNPEEDMEETYDTTPAEATDIPEFEAEKFAYQPNAGGKNKGVTNQPTAMTREELEQKLFAEYKEFLGESNS